MLHVPAHLPGSRTSRLIEWFCERAPASAAPEERTRLRVVVGTALALSVLNPVTVVSLAVAGDFEVVIACTAAQLFFLLLLIWIRKGGKFLGPGLLLCLGLHATVSIPIFMHGGIGVDGGWSLLVPLIATYLLGARGGVAFGGLLIGEIVVCHLLQNAGVLLNDKLEYGRPLRLFFAIAATGFLIVIGIIHDRSRLRSVSIIAEAMRAQARLLAAIESSPDGILILDGVTRTMYANAAVERTTGYAPSELIGQPFRYFQEDERSPVTLALREALAGGRAWSACVQIHLRRSGRALTVDATMWPVFGEGGAVTGHVVVLHDATERLRAAAELEALHRSLRDTSRAAGMAEVATSVLHNVGNVLNSVNISANLALQGVRDSKSAALHKVVALLAAHESDLAAFFGEDPRGRKLPAYLRAVSASIEREHERLSAELSSLCTHVEHIKVIVAMQQSSARSCGLVESVRLDALVGDVLRLHDDSADRHGLTIQREYAVLPAIDVDRHKLCQVLINLVANAKQAVMSGLRDERCITLRTRAVTGEMVAIDVVDTGCGIPEENLLRIFNHGFTTKENGHGFGLHSSANAAREMGGHLTVASDGVDRGATFTVVIPMRAHRGNEQEAA